MSSRGRVVGVGEAVGTQGVLGVVGVQGVIENQVTLPLSRLLSRYKRTRLRNVEKLTGNVPIRCVKGT